MDVCIEASIECTDEDGVIHKTGSIIDMAEFRGVSEIGGRPAHDTVKELKGIRSVIENLSNGTKKLQVDTHTSSDRKVEQDALKQQIDELERRKEARKKRREEQT